MTAHDIISELRLRETKPDSFKEKNAPWKLNSNTTLKIQENNVWKQTTGSKESFRTKYHEKSWYT